MSKDLIESSHAGEQEDNVVINNNAVSMKLVQSIYNELTGKTESIIRRLTDSHEVAFEDIKQLNIKIEQLYEQYNIVSKTCAVTLYHVNDCKEQYSSFERFSLRDSNSINPCENVRIEYKFLISLPNTRKVQQYSIKIDLHSRVGIKKRAETEHGSAKRFFRLLGTTTGIINIEYVDYTVARNFMTAIMDWHLSVSRNTPSKAISFWQDYSAEIPFIFRFASVFLLTCFFYSIGLNLEIDTNQALFLLLLLTFTTIYLASLFAHKMGMVCEYFLDGYQPISYIKVNKGDEIAIKKYSSLNNKAFILSSLSVTLAIVLNLASAFIYEHLIAKFLG